jgi:sugar phosphate permease
MACYLTVKRLEPGWRSATLAMLVAGYSGYYLCRSNLSVTMPLIALELQAGGMTADAARTWLGSLASLGVLAYAAGKVPSGALADRFGGRCNFLGGMGGSIVATACFAMAGSIPFFSIAWMGNRLFQSLGWAGAIKTVSKWFPFERHGTVMGVISLSYLFGDALSRQFLALLIREGLSWREVFSASAAVLGALFLLCLFLLRDSPAAIGEPEAADNPTNLFKKPVSLHGKRFATFALFNSKQFRLVCCISLGTTILRETFNFWTPAYFMQVVHMSVAQAAFSSGVFPFFGGVSVILCGWMSDRLGRAGRAMIILIGMLLSALVLLALNLYSPEQQYLAVALIGLLAFLLIGPYSFLAGAISLDFGGKQGSGTASGVIDTVGYLGGVLSGDTVARVSSSYGWTGTFLLLSGVAMLTSVAAGLFLKEQKSG